MHLEMMSNGCLCLCFAIQIADHVENSDGFLSKLSLYKGLALIALAQQGKQPSPKLLENCIQGKPEFLLLSYDSSPSKSQVQQMALSSGKLMGE